MTDLATAKYSIKLSPYAAKVEVYKNSTLLASSINTVCLYESVYEPTIYFPRKDLNFEVMEASNLVTFCPFKGNASYWNYLDRRSNLEAKNICWAYLDPIAESKGIKEHFAFFPNQITMMIDGQPKNYNTAQRNKPLINDRLASFTLLEAPKISDFESFFSRLATVCSEADPQIMQITLLIRTLHPQLHGYLYIYKKDEPIEKIILDQKMLAAETFLKSPLKPVLDRLGGVRCVLKDGQMLDEFPVLKEFKSKGVTDYCALPLTFSNGQMNVISFATRKPEGFSTSFLGSVHQAVGGITKFIENHVANQNMETFLKTYLGRLSSHSLLQGSTQRGDGKVIDCAFFFCDLRNSTKFISEMTKDAFLKLLGRYFDAVAEPILENGGEIVHYLGDAVLGFFPQQDGISPSEVCFNALKAAHSALENLETSNTKNNQGLSELRTGISLHFGECIYCNVGTKNRMDFSTIGPCVNKTVRIEGYTKMLDRPVLCTEDFFKIFEKGTQAQFEDMGLQQLRGFTEKEKIFAPNLDQLVKKLLGKQASKENLSTENILPL